MSLLCALLTALALGGLTSCAVTQPASVSSITTLAPSAVTLPYRLSETGTFIIDVDINGSAAIPMTLDSAASISALYEEQAEALGIELQRKNVLIFGISQSEIRPLTVDTKVKMGALDVPPLPLVVLANQRRTKETAGLIGADILGDYAVIFAPDTMTVTFIPSPELPRKSLRDWRRITLSHKPRGYPDYGLHFATSSFQDDTGHILIDTGLDRSVINWPLASQDATMRRLRRTLKTAWEIEGAIGTFVPQAEARLIDLPIDEAYWVNVYVSVIDIDTLSTAAPTHKPMIIMGADLFRGRTVVFDFGGDAIYIRPHPDDARPPLRNPLIVDLGAD